MSDNLSIWNKVARPPADALKTITGGRLSGKTDISPQWRIKIMTEQFGPIGTGWGYEIERLWTETGSEGQVCAFAQVNVWYGDVSVPRIPGIGGSMLIANEKNGPYTSDEAYKMAVTDALSVALKTLGVAADIYLGKWDGSKYKDDQPSGAVLPLKEIAECDTLDKLKALYVTTFKSLANEADKKILCNEKDRRKKELQEQAEMEAKSAAANEKPDEELF